MSKTVVVPVSSKGRVTLPDEVRRHIGLETGDYLLIDLSEDAKATLVSAAVLPKDQVWFTHPDVQARLAEAHDDIAAGRTVGVESQGELREQLRALKRKKRSA